MDYALYGLIMSEQSEVQTGSQANKWRSRSGGIKVWLRDRRVYRCFLEHEAVDLIREHGERAYLLLRDGVHNARRRRDQQSEIHL